MPTALEYVRLSALETQPAHGTCRDLMGHERAPSILWDGRTRCVLLSAPILPDNSGGGPFDALGHLIGFTAMRRAGGEAVNGANGADVFWR